MAEAPSHKFIKPEARAKAVTMTKAEGLAGYIHDIRLLENLNSQALKIMIAPDIVIALKEPDLDSIIYKIQDFSKNPDIPLGHHIAVLIPKIPDIAKQIQGFSPVSRHRFKERHKTQLAIRRITQIQSQMDVRNEICQITSQTAANRNR